jgi:hypothetical protein
VKHRQAVTRFRISAHKLPIETGRYANIEHDLRLCPICNSNEIGDEYHYFSHCSNKRLEKLRENFLNELVDFNCKFTSLGTNNLFLYCVSMNDKNIINSTSKYIYEIMNTFWDVACILLFLDLSLFKFCHCCKYYYSVLLCYLYIAYNRHLLYSIYTSIGILFE